MGINRLRDVLVVFAVIAVLLVALSALSSAGRGGASGMLYETFVSTLNNIDTGRMTSDGKQTACMFAATQMDDLCDGNVNIQKRMFFGDRNMSTEPSAENGTDPYYIEKIRPADNKSSLRLTINDDPDESFQIWGNSCAAGKGTCGGEGTQGHKFRADGTASHTGSLVVGDPNTATDNSGWTSDKYPMGGSLNIYNRHARNWTHFPWADGRNYIRNDTQIDGNTRVTGNIVVAQDGDPNFGVGVFANTKQDGATPDVYNGGIDSWFGIGFRCRMDNKTRFVHDTRTGTVKLYSGNGGTAALCIDDVCLNADDLRSVKELVSKRSMTVLNKVSVLGGFNMPPWNMQSFVDPQAKWIWNDPKAASNTGTSCITFEKTFRVDATIGIAIHVVVDDHSTVFLNGTNIGQPNGGWTGNPTKLSGTANKGPNVLQVQAKNTSGPAGLIVSVIAVPNNAVLARTDETWRWTEECV